MTFEDDFPSLQVKCDICGLIHKIPRLVYANCLDKQKVKDAISKLCVGSMARYDVGRLLKEELGLDDEI